MKACRERAGLAWDLGAVVPSRASGSGMTKGGMWAGEAVWMEAIQDQALHLSPCSYARATCSEAGWTSAQTNPTL